MIGKDPYGGGSFSLNLSGLLEEPDTKLQERSLPQTWPSVVDQRISREWGCKNQSFLSLHFQSVHVCPSYPTSAAVYILNLEHWTGLWQSTTFCMDKYVTHDVMMELDFWVWHFDNIRIGHCIGTAIYSFESPCSSVCNSNVFSAATEMRIAFSTLQLCTEAFLALGIWAGGSTQCRCNGLLPPNFTVLDELDGSVWPIRAAAGEPEESVSRP